MVLALAGSSTITSLVPWPFPAAPVPVALPLPPLSPLFEAAAVLPAALLFAGTLFPTSHQKRHGPSSRSGGLSLAQTRLPAASTIRGAATKCPSAPLSLQPG